jgi:LCP family protein required for cell wall assembly
MRVYRAEGGKPPKKRRRWLRVLLWTLLTIVIAVGAFAGVLQWKTLQAVDKITAVNTPAEHAAVNATSNAPITDTTPVTFVIFGVDTRTKSDGGSQSDTEILVRLDPVKKTLTQVAFTRDWLVQIPGYSGLRMINSAFALGGPRLALDTLYAATGIRPNYYITINFSGFKAAVGAFGGTYAEIDRRYFHRNSGYGTQNYLSIDIRPGYQRLNGSQALQFVRYRHTDDDTVRNSRQQRFLAAFKRQADPVTVGTNVFNLLNIARRYLKIIGHQRASETDLLRWAATSRAIPKENVISVRCTFTQAPSDRNREAITPTALHQCLDEFQHPDPTLATRSATATAGAGATTGPRAAFDPGVVAVEVRNGNGRAGAAAGAASQLVTQGWKHAVSNGDADRATYFQSVVYYGGGAPEKAAATELARMFAPAALQQLTPAIVATLGRSGHAVGANIVVVVGQTFTELPPATVKPVAPPVKANIVTSTGRDVPRWRSAARSTHLALWYPTRLPAGAQTVDPGFAQTVNPFRTYKVNGEAALHVTYWVPSLSYGVFGVQVVAWDSPPILEGPTATRTRNGVTYNLYYNGGKLDRVAWQAGGSWFWLSNTLIDELPNSTMWSVATSFARVPA